MATVLQLTIPFSVQKVIARIHRILSVTEFGLMVVWTKKPVNWTLQWLCMGVMLFFPVYVSHVWILLIAGYWQTSDMVGPSSEWVICIALSIGIGFTTSTDSLDFSQSNLTEVPICPVNHSIASINLDENQIQELFPHSFINCDELTKMSLASNGLQKIHDGTFDNIHKLNRLILNDNSIVQLPADFGPSTTTLTTISLLSAMRDPRLFNYPYFSAFTRLGIINLGLNNIGNLNDTFFPPNIRWIVANSGRMDTFPPISSLTPNIEVLAFAGHQLTTIPQKAVAGLFELKSLIMSKNIIKNFPNFSHCKKLTLLKFEHNELSYVPRKHIEGLESIREIHFTNNWLSNMTDIFHLISLQKFFIGYNLITEMPVWHIEGLPNMKTFACNNNKLKSLPNISAFFPELEELYVQGNYLKTLPDLFEFAHLVTLQSAENPYECNVSLCWLRMLPWLKPSVNKLQDSPVCDLPAAYTGTAVVRFHPTLMECYKGDAATVLFMCVYHVVTLWE